MEQALQPVFVCHYFLLLSLAINRVSYIFSLYALVVPDGYSQMHAPRFPQLPSAHVGTVRAPTRAQFSD